MAVWVINMACIAVISANPCDILTTAIKLDLYIVILFLVDTIRRLPDYAKASY